MVGSQERRVEGQLKGTQDAGDTLSKKVPVTARSSFTSSQLVSSVKIQLCRVYGQHLFIDLRAAYKYPFVFRYT